MTRLASRLAHRVQDNLVSARHLFLLFFPPSQPQLVSLGDSVPNKQNKRKYGTERATEGEDNDREQLSRLVIFSDRLDPGSCASNLG